jgi:hypothetical protein
MREVGGSTNRDLAEGDRSDEWLLMVKRSLSKPNTDSLPSLRYLSWAR